MTEREVLTFIKKITENSPDDKVKLNLTQLKSILESQCASVNLIDLITNSINSIPEIREISKDGELTPIDIQIAQKRANNRKMREYQMARQGRC